MLFLANIDETDICSMYQVNAHFCYYMYSSIHYHGTYMSLNNFPKLVISTSFEKLMSINFFSSTFEAPFEQLPNHSNLMHTCTMVHLLFLPLSAKVNANLSTTSTSSSMRKMLIVLESSTTLPTESKQVLRTSYIC